MWMLNVYHEMTEKKLWFFPYNDRNYWSKLIPTQEFQTITTIKSTGKEEEQGAKNEKYLKGDILAKRYTIRSQEPEIMQSPK